MHQAEPEPAAEPSAELVPVRPQPPTISSRRTPDAPVVLRQVVEVLRTAAEVLIDVADATAEALKKRLQGRA